jgi:hypothetical protein
MQAHKRMEDLVSVSLIETDAIILDFYSGSWTIIHYYPPS